MVKGELEKIAEGKTKIIRRSNHWPGKVIVINKDDLTKKDGQERLILPGKGGWATETTCNVFKLLKERNIPVAYEMRLDGISFMAYEADMLKLEIVVRNIKFGSYLKRHPEAQEGEVCNEPVIEIFFKSDKDHDPFMVFDLISGHWLLFDAKKPLAEGFIREMSFLATSGNIIIDAAIIKQIMEIARQVNSVLTEAWSKQRVALVDFKIEVGFAIINGKLTLVLADVIDNDSWRIWPLGDKYKMKDKEVFRMLKEVTPEDRNRLKENYEWVANATKEFLN